jgi:hypothetical protein
MVARLGEKGRAWGGRRGFDRRKMGLTTNRSLANRRRPFGVDAAVGKRIWATRSGVRCICYAPPGAPTDLC